MSYFPEGSSWSVWAWEGRNRGLESLPPQDTSPNDSHSNFGPVAFRFVTNREIPVVRSNLLVMLFGNSWSQAALGSSNLKAFLPLRLGWCGLSASENSDRSPFHSPGEQKRASHKNVIVPAGNWLTGPRELVNKTLFLACCALLPEAPSVLQAQCTHAHPH